MPAALTHVSIASSSISSVVNPGMTPLSQLPSSKPSSLSGPSDPQREAEFDEIERLLKEPLPDVPEPSRSSPYAIGHRIRHNNAKKRRAAEKRSATLGGPPNTLKYIISQNNWFIEVHSNKSVLVNRHNTTHGKFHIRAEVPDPNKVMGNVTDGRAVSRSKPNGYQHRVTIQSLITSLFLCMNARGIIYASSSKKSDCIFRQDHANVSYYYFISDSHPRPGTPCRKKRRKRPSRTGRTSRSANECRWFLMVKKKKNDGVEKLATYKLEGDIGQISELGAKKRDSLRFVEWPATDNRYHTQNPPVFTFAAPTTPATPRTTSSEFLIGKGKNNDKGGKKKKRCNSNNLLSDCPTRQKSRRKKPGKGDDFKIGRSSRRKQKSQKRKKGSGKRGADPGIFNVGG